MIVNVFRLVYELRDQLAKSLEFDPRALKSIAIESSFGQVTPDLDQINDALTVRCTFRGLPKLRLKELLCGTLQV